MKSDTLEHLIAQIHRQNLAWVVRSTVNRGIFASVENPDGDGEAYLPPSNADPLKALAQAYHAWERQVENRKGRGA